MYSVSAQSTQESEKSVPIVHLSRTGNTVIPFNTHGGYGVGCSFQQVEELCPDSNILVGFSIQGGLERGGIYLDIKGERGEEVHAEVRQWLRQIKL